MEKKKENKFKELPVKKISKKENKEAKIFFSSALSLIIITMLLLGFFTYGRGSYYVFSLTQKEGRLFSQRTTPFPMLSRFNGSLGRFLSTNIIGGGKLNEIEKEAGDDGSKEEGYFIAEDGEIKEQDLVDLVDFYQDNPAVSDKEIERIFNKLTKKYNCKSCEEENFLECLEEYTIKKTFYRGPDYSRVAATLITGQEGEEEYYDALLDVLSDNEVISHGGDINPDSCRGEKEIETDETTEDEEIKEIEIKEGKDSSRTKYLEVKKGEMK
jgi:hypothetical protein